MQNVEGKHIKNIELSSLTISGHLFNPYDLGHSNFIGIMRRRYEQVTDERISDFDVKGHESDVY